MKYFYQKLSRSLEKEQTTRRLKTTGLMHKKGSRATLPLARHH